MATLTELCDAISSTGVRWAQVGFAEGDGANRPTRLPFVILMPTGAQTFVADGRVYVGLTEYDVELYARSRWYDKERELEAAFLERRIPWEKRFATPGDGVIETVWSVSVLDD